MKKKTQVTVEIYRHSAPLMGYTWSFTLPHGARCRSDVGCFYATDAEKEARGMLSSLKKANYEPIFTYPCGI